MYWLICFMGTVFQEFWKKSDISEHFDIYNFGWIFSALLFRIMSQRFMEDENKLLESILTNRG